MDSINDDAGNRGESRASFPDESHRKATALDGCAGEGSSSAVDQAREDSLSNILELRDSPIYVKMEDFGGSLFSDDFAWNVTESEGLAGGADAACDRSRDSTLDFKMENLDGDLFPDESAGKSIDLIGLAGEGAAANVHLYPEDSLAKSFELGGSPFDMNMEEGSLITPSGVEVGAPLITKPVDSVDGSDSDDDSDSSELEAGNSESDGLSSAETETSSASSSEEEKEQDENAGKGDGEGSLEMVIGPIDNDEDDVVKGPIRSKNELENLPPVPPIDVSLEPHHQTLPVGLICSVLDNKVIVEGSASHNPLNEGSILWITDTRSPLGLIDEIFGPVKCPYYVVRYNSDKDIPPGIKEGTTVSFVSEFACYVLEKDISKRGYDASGDNDEELNGEVEFSDDEMEAEYRRSLRQAKRGTDDKKHGNWETGTHKKGNIKSRGAQKGKNQPMPGTRGNSMGHSGAAVSSYDTPSGATNTHVSTSSIPIVSPQLVLGGGVTNPPSQFLNQVNALSSSGVPGVQQPFLQPQYGMPIPLLQQQFGVLPFGLPLQLQPNAAVAGFQMNVLPNPQLGVEAYCHQLQNQGYNNIQNMMSYGQQLLPNSNLPSVGNNFSTGYTAPRLPGGGYGQAYVCAQLGNCNISNNQAGGQLNPASTQGQIHSHLQFNPGNSSVQGRKPSKYGGRHKFQGGAQNRNR